MAFQMAWTDAAGNSCPNSYWVVADVRVNLKDGIATISYYGWKDQPSQAAGLFIMPQAIHQYSFTGPAFATFFQQFAASETPFLSAADAMALATKDIIVDPADLTQNVSFFAGATQVANPTFS